MSLLRALELSLAHLLSSSSSRWRQASTGLADASCSSSSSLSPPAYGWSSRATLQYWINIGSGTAHKSVLSVCSGSSSLSPPAGGWSSRAILQWNPSSQQPVKRVQPLSFPSVSIGTLVLGRHVAVPCSSGSARIGAADARGSRRTPSHGLAAAWAFSSPTSSAAAARLIAKPAAASAGHHPLRQLQALSMHK